MKQPKWQKARLLNEHRPCETLWVEVGPPAVRSSDAFDVETGEWIGVVRGYRTNLHFQGRAIVITSTEHMIELLPEFTDNPDSDALEAVTQCLKGLRAGPYARFA